jgi:hypothetical protein
VFSGEVAGRDCTMPEGTQDRIFPYLALALTLEYGYPTSW